MTEPLKRPKRKNPLKKTRLPLSPQGVRSRTAHGLTAAAAEGRFALQVCADCGTGRLSAARRLPVVPVAPPALPRRRPGGTLVAETTVRISTDPYFRERTPWRVGTVKLDAGPVVVAHLHGDAVEGDRVRARAQARQERRAGRDRAAGEGHSEHGRRPAACAR